MFLVTEIMGEGLVGRRSGVEGGLLREQIPPDQATTKASSQTCQLEE